MATSKADVSIGKVGFIERHELCCGEQKDAAHRIEADICEKGPRQIRIAWADQHGIARGKTMTVFGFSAALRKGTGLAERCTDNGHDQQHQENATRLYRL